MLIGAFVVVFLLAIAAAIAVGLRASKAASESRERDDASRSQLDERLGGLEQKLEQRLGGIEEKVDRRLDGLDGRLLTSQTSSNETATQIVERLGKLDGTAAQMLQQATNLSRLEQALRPPKARGGFGEILLGKLLADTLPADAY